MAVKDSEPLVFKEKTENHIVGLVEAINYYKSQNGKNKF
jgi:hypothetical protein